MNVQTDDSYYDDPRWDEVARLQAEAWRNCLGFEDLWVVELQKSWSAARELADQIRRDHQRD